MSSDVDSWIGSCVAHLQDNSSQYFAMIRKKGGGYILWAVFSLVGGFQVVIKRASYLSIATMQTTKAQSLQQMYYQCDSSHQFVCWFTLEDDRGTPLTSKVVIVDSAGRSGRSSPAPSSQTASTGPVIARPNQHPSTAPNPNSEMQHVLRVALQVADSVAVLSAAVESLQSRVAALEERQERQAAERVTAATLSAVIERVVAVEALAADAETRTRTFGNLHEQMFQQFTQLKRDVLGAHNPSAPPSHSRVAPTEADVMTPVGAVGRAAPALAAGAPPSSERPAVPSPQRQATFAAPTESLSDMIKHMEMKLQKIRIPAK